MAMTTMDTDGDVRGAGMMTRLTDWLGGLFVRMGNASAGAAAARRAARLNAMTDAQLTQLGIKRDEIVERSFRRLTWS